MTSESDMPAAGALAPEDFAANDFAANGFAADGFDCAFFGIEVVDADVFSAESFAALAGFAVDCEAAFLTGVFTWFFTCVFMFFFLDVRLSQTTGFRRYSILPQSGQSMQATFLARTTFLSLPTIAPRQSVIVWSEIETSSTKRIADFPCSL